MASSFGRRTHAGARFVLVLRVPPVARAVREEQGAEGIRSVLSTLAELGTAVVEKEPGQVLDLEASRCRAVVVDGGERLDLAHELLRDLHTDEAFREVPSLLVLSEKKISALDPSSPFSDFIDEEAGASELYARIRRLEWRVSEFSTTSRFKAGRLYVDREAHEVRLDGVPVTMTRKEYSLLLFLLERKGRTFSREALLQGVWGFDYEGGERTIDIHIQRLRKKLGEVISLETVRGVGYRVADNVDARPKVLGPTLVLAERSIS